MHFAEIQIPIAKYDKPTPCLLHQTFGGRKKNTMFIFSAIIEITTSMFQREHFEINARRSQTLTPFQEHAMLYFRSEML